MKLTGLIPEAGNKEIDGVITHINDEAEFTPKNVQTRQGTFAWYTASR
jgi:HlyD family secretion protein